MVSDSRPTRAEVTDFSQGVAVGSNAVMLSAETAAGKDPVEAVEMMDRIARQAEAHLWPQEGFGSLTLSEDDTAPIAFGTAVARSTALVRETSTYAL